MGILTYHSVFAVITALSLVRVTSLNLGAETGIEPVIYGL